MGSTGAQLLPPIFTKAESYFSDHGVLLSCDYTAPAGSRTTSRVAVRASDGGVMIGLFEPGTHNVRPCMEDPCCRLPHHPAINDAINTISEELEAFQKLSAYDETAGHGTLRYLQLSVERLTRRVQVVLVVNLADADADPALKCFCERLWAKHCTNPQQAPSLLWHSIWLNFNPSSTNNIVSYTDGAWKLLHHLSADPKAGHREALCKYTPPGCLHEAYPSGASFVLPPFVFRQANLDGFDGIVAALRAATPTGARVVEWYAGVGALGLSLAGDAEWVRCSDVNPPRSAFEASRALLPAHVRPRVSYSVGRAALRIEDARGADVALVDPPRKGLDPPLLAALCDASPNGPCASIRTIIYVSCGFPALARELELLLDAGWRVRDGRATAYVLFTDANHIETLVILDRMPPNPQLMTREQEGAALIQSPHDAPARESRRGQVHERLTPRQRRLTKNKRARARKS